MAIKEEIKIKKVITGEECTNRLQDGVPLLHHRTL